MRALRFSVFGAVAVAIGCVWACLPDLQLTPYLGPVCGDGIISPDAGEQCDPGYDASPQMLSTICSDGCKVVCDAGGLPLRDPVSNHCYFTLTPNGSTGSANVSAGDAAAGCEQAGGHVVRFASQNELALVANHGGTQYWIGLQETTLDSGIWLPLETTNEPGWSPGCAGCFAHIPDASTIPDPAPPLAPGRCVIDLPASGNMIPSWTRSSCEVHYPPVCEREPPGTRTSACAEGACFTVAATVGTKRYLLLGSPSGSAADAVRGCAELDGGLVVFGSREEREQVGYEIGTETVRQGANDFWIGLSTNDAGVWTWNHDGGLEPLPWGIDEPARAPSLAGAARAYVVVSAGVIDSELAHAQVDVGEAHYAVCEFR